jgi:D-beta-D-heptose 7-phosphate kinase/D-beta-D-heptose 1-phosphate adenosyltransferase
MHVPAAAREVFDVTGAGDTVVATMALALAAGASLPEAAVLANCAAGVVVGKVGTAQATPRELLAAARLSARGGGRR